MKTLPLPISIICHLALGVQDAKVDAFLNICSNLPSHSRSVGNQRCNQVDRSTPTRLGYSEEKSRISPSLDQELAKLWSSGSLETFVDGEVDDVNGNHLTNGNDDLNASRNQDAAIVSTERIAFAETKLDNYDSEHLMDHSLEPGVEFDKEGSEDTPEYEYDEDVTTISRANVMEAENRNWDPTTVSKERNTFTEIKSDNHDSEHLLKSSFKSGVELDNGWSKDTPEYEYDGEMTTLSSDTDNNNWSSSAERRQQRMQSLTSFNTLHHHTKQKQSQHQTQNHALTRQRPPKFNLPTNDQSQLQAIQSNAPAILLSSGPGTGKSHVLSLRIAYLLRMQLEYETGNDNSMGFSDISTKPAITNSIGVEANSMVILSFTNKDAERLKENALNYMFPNIQGEAVVEATNEWRNQTSKQLWSGTMHVFALAILRKYGYSASTPLRVLPARAMRNRVSQSLRSLLNGGEDADVMNGEQLDRLRMRHLQALHDVGQSRSILYQNMVKCIDLWKEALLIPSMSSQDVTSCDGELALKDLSNEQHQQQLDRQKELELRDDCVDLAVRLGIPETSALLALDVFPAYQVSLHP